MRGVGVSATRRTRLPESSVDTQGGRQTRYGLTCLEIGRAVNAPFVDLGQNGCAYICIYIYIYIYIETFTTSSKADNEVEGGIL